MSKQSIKVTIDANIKQNGVQAITGQIMNSVLNQMVDNLAEEASTTERLTELENELSSDDMLEVPVSRLDGVQVLPTIISVATQTTFYCPIKANIPIHVLAVKSTDYFRFGFTTSTPAVGVKVSNYGDSGQNLDRSFVSTQDGYFVISMVESGSTLRITTENNGHIGRDVAMMKEEIFGVAKIFSKVIQSGSTSVSYLIPVDAYKGQLVQVNLKSSPLSANHSVYRTKSKDSSGIIDGVTMAVGETRYIYITQETNYLWFFVSGSVATTSDIVVGIAMTSTIDANVESLMAAPSFEYLFSDGFLYISKHSGNKDLVISFGKGGGNNLWDFRGFYTKEVGTPLLIETLTKFHSNGSDWFAPFKIRAVNNIDGDDYSNSVYDEYFTGGAHQYNNLVSGSTPTARGTDTEIRVDGKVVTSGSGIGNKLSMQWSNYIQAYNTRKADGSGREVLKETIILTFDGFKWDAETILEPLEAIKLDLWYGYQMTGVGESMASHWRYINAVNRTPDQSNSGNYDAIGFEAYGGQCNVRCEINPLIDLGKREQLWDNSTQGAFKSGTKLYFTIANKWIQLNENESYYLKGAYYIERP